LLFLEISEIEVLEGETFEHNNNKFIYLSNVPHFSISEDRRKILLVLLDTITGVILTQVKKVNQVRRCISKF